MSAVSVNITVGGSAAAMLNKLDAALVDRAELNQDIATREENMVRDYLISIAGTRHKTADRLGATPTGHLERAAESVTSESSADAATITITSPGITRAFSDITITPGPGKKYLTIPATGEAYGKRARTFNDLRLAFFKKGTVLALVKAEQSDVATRRRSGYTYDNLTPLLTARRAPVYYWLRESVSQQQDRTLLPSDALLQSAAEEGVNDWLRAFLGM